MNSCGQASDGGLAHRPRDLVNQLGREKALFRLPETAIKTMGTSVIGTTDGASHLVHDVPMPYKHN